MVRRFQFCVTAGVVFLFCVLQAVADENTLKEVVVTASLDRNPMAVAQPTSVLSGDDLLRQLAGSLGETLSRQLGVSSSYFGPTASRPVIRGLGGYRVQTLQDGLSTLDVGGLSDDHATTLDPALAEQLEVLKGPATLLYGSGASGGLINVVTNRIPARKPDAGNGGLGELRGDTAADTRAGVVSLHGSSAQFAFHGDYAKSNSGAIDIPGMTISDRLSERLLAAGELVDSHQGSIPNAFSETQSGALGASWHAPFGMIGASVSRYASEYGIPSEAAAFIDMQQDRYDAKAEWRPDNTWLRTVTVSGTYNDYTHTEFEAPGVPGTEFDQHAFEVRVAANHVHSDGWRGVFGAQITHLDFVAIGDEAFVPASTTRNVGAFFLEEFALNSQATGDWTLNVGARLEKQIIDARVAANQPDFDATAASFSSGVVFNISDEDSFAVNLTRSSRHPQATELYANGPHVAAQRFEIGDATLATEVANTLDIGLRRNGDTVSWLLSVFYNDYENFVFAEPTGNQVDGLTEAQYRQTPAALYGYEAELWTPLYTGATGVLRLRLMSDYVRGARQGGEPLPQIPPLRVGAGLHFDRGGWHAEVEALRSANQGRVAGNELATDGYTMANADVSVRWSATHGEWLVFVRATNLLDEEARQHASSLKDRVPLPGRSINAGLRATF